MSGATDDDIETLIDAARVAGADDPEHEIESLQDLLRMAWSLMTEVQQAALMESDEAQSVLAKDEDDEPDDE